MVHKLTTFKKSLTDNVLLVIPRADISKTRNTCVGCVVAHLNPGLYVHFYELFEGDSPVSVFVVAGYGALDGVAV